MASWLLSLYSAFRAFPGAKNLVRFVSAPDYPGRLRCEAFGLWFSCPVGLSCGVDIDGSYSMDIDDLHFGYIQVGPVYLEENARTVISNLNDDKMSSPISACLAPYPSSLDMDVQNYDLRRSFTYLYDFVDMFTLDLSGIDAEGHPIADNLDKVVAYIDGLLDIRLCYSDIKPLLLKISSDCSMEYLEMVLDYCRYNGVDGIIVGGSNDDRSKSFDRCLSVVGALTRMSGGVYPIIASGNINTADKAAKARSAGAWMVESDKAFNWRHPFIVKSFTAEPGE